MSVNKRSRSAARICLLSPIPADCACQNSLPVQIVHHLKGLHDTRAMTCFHKCLRHVPAIVMLDGRMHAAATTGPASGPRPASSTPATNRYPCRQSFLCRNPAWIYEFCLLMEKRGNRLLEEAKKNYKWTGCYTVTNNCCRHTVLSQL